MSTVKLSELIFPAPSVRLGSKRDLPILSMTMHNGLVDQADKFKKRIASIDLAPYKVVSRGQLVVGFPIDEAVLAFQDLHSEAVVSPAYAIWNVDKDRADQAYLERYLHGPQAITFYKSRLQGSTARRRSLPNDVFLSMEIPLPPLPEQRRIASILDQADNLRTVRQQAKNLMDEMALAIFNEMFGDPGTNPKGLPVGKLRDLVSSVSDGPHVSPKYVGEGIPILSARHVKNGQLVFEDAKYLSPEDAHVQWKKCKPERGDVVYTKGGTTGLAAPVQTDEPFTVWVHLALLKVRADAANGIWLAAMLNSQFCYSQSQTLTRGITNRDLGLKRMVDIKVVKPLLTLQLEFVERLETAQAVSRKHSEQISRFDELFASLQHRAFRGEL